MKKVNSGVWATLVSLIVLNYTIVVVNLVGLVGINTDYIYSWWKVGIGMSFVILLSVYLYYRRG
jgi:hypothetical protein